jgi:hypothetical protein
VSLLVERLSGGQRQAVAIARATAFNLGDHHGRAHRSTGSGPSARCSTWYVSSRHRAHRSSSSAIAWKMSTR